MAPVFSTERAWHLTQNLVKRKKKMKPDNKPLANEDAYM